VPHQDDGTYYDVAYCALCATRRASALSVLPRRGLTPVCDNCWRDCVSADATLTNFEEWRTLYSRLKQK